MKTDAADNTVRMRVRGAREIPSSGVGSSGTAGCGRIECAVGEIDRGEGIESVVWIRGGPEHDAVQVEHDASSDAKSIHVALCTLCMKPKGLSDEAALLADGIASAIHAAKIVESHKLHNLAVFTTCKTATTAYSFVNVLHKICGQTREPHPDVTIVFMDSVPSEAANTTPHARTRAFFHEDTELKSSLKLDGCLDLCCSDGSIGLATRHVEPLGMVILLPPTEQDPESAVAVDMNAVVVNELVLRSVGDYREELPRALEFLAEESVFRVTNL